MSENHNSYVLSIKLPTKPSYSACLVITPKRRHSNIIDVEAKIERNLGHDKCVQVAYRLLELSGASADLLKQVHALAPNLTHPITP